MATVGFLGPCLKRCCHGVVLLCKGSPVSLTKSKGREGALDSASARPLLCWVHDHYARTTESLGAA